ncbi:MAG: M2 family metallopeptidase [Bacillus sp. (in: Bacteria)]|nr:M2 family metallopeptidase [Bacillus sp. (in: firmicutes)]
MIGSGDLHLKKGVEVMTVQQFLDEQNKQVKELYQSITHASWMAQTTGEAEWAKKVAEAQTSFRTYFSNPEALQTIENFLKEIDLTALERRQLETLEKTFKENQLPADTLKELSQLSAELNHMFNTYEPEVNGKKLSANDIRNILLNSEDLQEREDAWKASKEVGKVVEEKTLNTHQSEK